MPNVIVDNMFVTLIEFDSISLNQIQIIEVKFFTKGSNKIYNHKNIIMNECLV
jgi:hypothetical protein